MSSNKQHIVFFTPGFARDEQDWYCIPPLQGLVEALGKVAPEIEITILALHYPYHAHTYTWKGRKIIALGQQNRGGLSKPLGWQRARKALKSIHREKPIDLLHSFWLDECAYLGALFCQKHGIPQVTTLMGQDAWKPNRYQSRTTLKTMRLITISDRAAKSFRKLGYQGLMKIIPWGGDHMIRNQAGLNPSDERGYDLVGVGNLVGVKNYGLFLETVAELIKIKPDVSALLIGGGPEEAMLKGRSKELAISENIEFAGHMDRPDILKRLLSARVFLHTALFEGQGYVFLEAQATGLPIVSTAVGMARESDRWRIATDAEGLATACLHFLESGTRFPPICPITIEDTARAYLEIYQG